ncbi:MAG: UDP-N-acetylmuramate dehydrogenase [Gammaproteobacteria bacterium]|nr:UDP-N-acetylmuramate dehydrogenase [Gammaproteobacteria bacterium]
MMIGDKHYELEHIKGELLSNELLSKHTTWKVGGPATLYFKPESKMDLQQFLITLNDSQPILWLGLGSNILFPDNGFNGVVINAVGQLKTIAYEQISENNTKVTVEVGVTCSKFSREMANKGLLGAEFFSGIPGSIGGALAMNAGAFNGETWKHVTNIETIDIKGLFHHKHAKQFEVSYRHVKGLEQRQNQQKEWYVSAEFLFEKNPELVQVTKQNIKTMLLKRNQSQPVQQANAGSVFKNPKGYFAAKLIEQCNLKNTQIGDAIVSNKHANFIINQGHAKAADILKLIELVQETVLKQTGVLLEREVVVIENSIEKIEVLH